MFEADPLPDIEDVAKQPIIDPGTSVAKGLGPDGGVVRDPNEDIVDRITGKVIKVEETLERKSSIPVWAWLLGGGVLAYFIFIRK